MIFFVSVSTDFLCYHFVSIWNCSLQLKDTESNNLKNKSQSRCLKDKESNNFENKSQSRCLICLLLGWKMRMTCVILMLKWFVCQHFWKYRPISQNTDQIQTNFWHFFEKVCITDQNYFYRPLCHHWEWAYCKKWPLTWGLIQGGLNQGGG